MSAARASFDEVAAAISNPNLELVEAVSAAVEDQAAVEKRQVSSKLGTVSVVNYVQRVACSDRLLPL